MRIFYFEITMLTKTAGSNINPYCTYVHHRHRPDDNYCDDNWNGKQDTIFHIMFIRNITNTSAQTLLFNQITNFHNV